MICSRCEVVFKVKTPIGVGYQLGNDKVVRGFSMSSSMTSSKSFESIEAEQSMMCYEV